MKIHIIDQERSLSPNGKGPYHVRLPVSTPKFPKCFSLEDVELAQCQGRPPSSYQYKEWGSAEQGRSSWDALGWRNQPLWPLRQRDRVFFESLFPDPALKDRLGVKERAERKGGTPPIRHVGANMTLLCPNQFPPHWRSTLPPYLFMDFLSVLMEFWCSIFQRIQMDGWIFWVFRMDNDCSLSQCAASYLGIW